MKINEAVNSHRDQEIVSNIILAWLISNLQSTLLNDNKIVERLEKCFTFFKTHEGSDYSLLEQAIDQLQNKFAKKEPMSDNMKEMVLKPIAIQCGLEAETAFQLLDSFFMADFQHLSYFQHVDRRIKEFQG